MRTPMPEHVSYDSSPDAHSVIHDLASSYCLIALGANLPGSWGAPRATLCRSIDILGQNQVSVVRRSRLYETLPHAGAGLMAPFSNMVLLARTNLSTGGLMRCLKAIEKQAGRRPRQRWSARPLDLDLIAHNNLVINWPVPNFIGGPFVLPHPLMHRRGFVLVPLAEVAPRWRHPVLGLTADEMLKREPGLRRGVLPA
jgi:2-amino-4-hydroxy-6-hydroxymethyldihydropteridine diphosphokinase